MSETRICVCGHPRGSHQIRWAGELEVRRLLATGKKSCSACDACTWYTAAVEVDTSDRSAFQARAKQPKGNTGLGHPLLLGLSKVETFEWQDMACGGCSVALTPQSAIVLDSAFYCGPCFIQRPEVYCGFVQEAKAG